MFCAGYFDSKSDACQVMLGVISRQVIEMCFGQKCCSVKSLTFDFIVFLKKRNAPKEMNLTWLLPPSFFYYVWCQLSSTEGLQGIVFLLPSHKAVAVHWRVCSGWACRWWQWITAQLAGKPAWTCVGTNPRAAASCLRENKDTWVGGEDQWWGLEEGAEVSIVDVTEWCRMSVNWKLCYVTSVFHGMTSCSYYFQLCHTSALKKDAELLWW